MNEDDDLISFWDSIDDEGNLPDTSDVDQIDETEDETQETEESGEFEDAIDAEEAEEADTDEEATEEPEDAVEDEPEIDLGAELKKAQAEISTMAGRLRAAEDRAKAPPPQTESAPAAPDEDEEFLGKFKEEYKEDVLRAIDIIASRRAREIAGNVLDRVAPIEQQAAQLAEQNHFNTIEAVHPDVVEVDQSEDFNKWIESKPVHVRGAYQFVRERGSAAEVISMLNEYKAESTKPESAPKATSTRPIAPVVKRKRGTTQVAPQNRAKTDEELWAEIPEDL